MHTTLKNEILQMLRESGERNGYKDPRLHALYHVVLHCDSEVELTRAVMKGFIELSEGFQEISEKYIDLEMRTPRTTIIRSY